MTLSQTAVLTRQVIFIFSLTLILGTISFIGFNIWHAYYLAHLPPVEEKPDTKFGQLPPLNFPPSKVSSSNFSYSIDTSTGNLPKIGIDPGFDKLIKIYFVTKTFASLLSGEKSQNLAEKFNIQNPPEILSDTNYLFREDNKSLNVDLDSGNFIFKKEATFSGQESLDDDNKLVSDFEGVLQNLGVFKEDLKTGRTKVVLLKNDSGKLIPTDLRTEAVAVQISLWPTAIDKKPIFTSEYDRSEIFAVVLKSANNLDNYLTLNFTYYPIDTSTFATYPLKSAEVAFEDLKNGKGVISIEPAKSNVSITSMYLAYFLAQEYSPYLQPIFVFEGPHFAAYVAAVSPEFIGVSEQFQTLAK